MSVRGVPAHVVPPARGPLSTRAPLQRVVALVPLIAAVHFALAFPVARVALLGALAGLLLVCLRWPAAWLALIPALLPLCDLAPWSGRMFLQEIDLALLVLSAACLWHGQYRPSRRRGLPLGFLCALGLFTLSYLVSLYLGLTPLPPPGVNDWSSYYSPYNALRVARGFLWALVFLPPLHCLFRRAPDTARRALLAGVIAGLLGTGLAVLWERGVLHDLLYGDSVYARLQSLLDFTTPYRITGLFSSMHTGGESIDGYLALAWPCALFALFLRPRSTGLALAGALTLPLALYAVVTTFSRASFLALGVSLAAFGVGAFVALGRRVSWRRAWLLVGCAAGLVVAAGVGFARGGTLALAAAAAGFGGSAVLGFFAARVGRPVTGAGFLLGGLATLALIRYAQVSSKWISVAPGTAALVALGLAVTALVLGAFTGWLARGSLDAREFAAGGLLVLAVTGTLLPALLGYRMEARFSEVSRDIETRRSHWRDGLALAPTQGMERLWGAGLGTFPRRYLLAYPDKVDGLSVLAGNATDPHLEILGGKDVKVTQRVWLPAYRDYVVRLKYRLDAPEANIRVRICRRHLINPTEYNAACVGTERNVKSTGGEWASLEHPVALGALGVHAGNLARAPLLLELTNRREYRLMEQPPAMVAFDDVELLDEAGFDQLHNGDFSAGMDRWFILYDFNHLPWHAKNLFVHLRVEQGWLGLGAFLLLMASALHRGLRAGLAGDTFTFALTVSLLGFMAIGLVGTMLDVPRIMLLCYLLMFAVVLGSDAAVAQARAHRPRGARSRPRSST